MLLRKYAIIAVSTFEYRDMHQLHMVLAVLIMALHFHDSQKPFGRDNQLAQRLHRFEMWSLLVLLFVMWSGVYFSMDASTESDSCNEYSVVCWLFVATILGSNLCYLIILSCTCCSEFGKRNHFRARIRSALPSINLGASSSSSRGGSGGSDSNGDVEMKAAVEGSGGREPRLDDLDKGLVFTRNPLADSGNLSA